MWLATKLMCKYQWVHNLKCQPVGAYNGRIYDIYNYNEKDKVPRSMKKTFIKKTPKCY